MNWKAYRYCLPNAEEYALTYDSGILIQLYYISYSNRDHIFRISLPNRIKNVLSLFADCNQLTECDGAADARSYYYRCMKGLCFFRFVTNISCFVHACIRKILPVEDEKELSRAVTAILEHAKYAVDAAYDGAEALELAENNAYDVMVFDTMMPKMDGIELLKRIRQSGNDTPVIMLTAKSEIDDRIIGLSMAETIVRLHKGKITAQQQGQRVSFTITLPV